MSNRRKRRFGRVGRTVRLTCTGRDRHDTIRLWTIIDRRASPARAPGGPIGAGIQVLDQPLPGERGAMGFTIDERGRTTFALHCPLCDADGRVNVQFTLERLAGELLEREYSYATSTDPMSTVTADVSYWQ